MNEDEAIRRAIKVVMRDPDKAKALKAGKSVTIDDIEYRQVRVDPKPNWILGGKPSTFETVLAIAMLSTSICLIGWVLL